MSELDPALFAEMGKRHLTLFGAVRIEMPARTVRLVDGAAEVPIDGEIYAGKDPEWGSLDSIKGLTDSNGDTAATPSVTMTPSNDLALATMLDPALQGSPILIMIGALDRASGLPVGTMHIRFAGELDVPKVRWGDHDRRVEFSLSSLGERIFMTEEGRRLSDDFHQRVWPGEKGLEFVTDVEQLVPWGQTPKTSSDAIRTDRGGFGLGGGGLGPSAVDGGNFYPGSRIYR